MGVVYGMPKLTSASVDFSRKLRSAMTDAERALWQQLRLRQMGVKFRRQHPVGKYVVDFACIEARLCIEVDGSQHATSSSDAARTQFLKSEGYEVLRFWDNDVLTAIDSVKEAIWKALQNRKPPPP
jgi:very-short-patch-repair endonuclease